MMEKMMTTQELRKLILAERQAGRRKNFPVKIKAMSKRQQLAFTLDLETIRKRGMYR